MPRKPRQKRTYLDDGSMSVAAKNPNGSGSVYYEPPSVRPDGRERAGRWRATYTDNDGKRRLGHCGIVFKFDGVTFVAHNSSRTGLTYSTYDEFEEVSKELPGLKEMKAFRFPKQG